MRLKFSSDGFNAKQLRSEKSPNKQTKYKKVTVKKKKKKESEQVIVFRKI